MKFLRRVLLALSWAIPSYFLGLFSCLWLLPYFSQNQHDSSIEAAMTGAFVFGPLLFVLGFLIGFSFHGPRHSTPPSKAGQDGT